jgi:hypothetical protein
MTTIDKEIKRLIADTTERMLKGNAADYTAYASLVARYRVLTEIKLFLNDQRRADDQGDDEPDAET